MDIIALDLWDKRVWVARAQEGIAFPLDVIARTSIVSYLKKYHQNSPIKTLVIWLPYDLYWKDTKQLLKTQTFIKKLQDIFPDIYILWHDERYSSYIADRDTNWYKDAHAAQVILESYLSLPKNTYL